MNPQQAEKIQHILVNKYATNAIHTNLNDDAVLIEILQICKIIKSVFIDPGLLISHVCVQCLFLKAPQHHYTLIATHWPGTNLDNLVENVVYIHLIVLIGRKRFDVHVSMFYSIG